MKTASPEQKDQTINKSPDLFWFRFFPPRVHMIRPEEVTEEGGEHLPLPLLLSDAVILWSRRRRWFPQTGNDKLNKLNNFSEKKSLRLKTWSRSCRHVTKPVTAECNAWQRNSATSGLLDSLTDEENTPCHDWIQEEKKVAPPSSVSLTYFHFLLIVIIRSNNNKPPPQQCLTVWRISVLIFLNSQINSRFSFYCWQAS